MNNQVDQVKIAIEKVLNLSCLVMDEEEKNIILVDLFELFTHLVELEKKFRYGIYGSVNNKKPQINEAYYFKSIYKTSTK